jgi:hypothetical protein
LVPVLFHRIGVDIFLYSGFISLGLIFFFLLILSRVSKEKFRNSKTYIYMSVVGVYVGINFLYFTNLIPPLPISIEDSGVYYSITRSDDGNYSARYKYLGLISHILFYPKVSIQEESDIYAYSAVFSPTYFDTSVIHEWQHYDEVNKVWTTATFKRLDRNHYLLDGYPVTSNLMEVFINFRRTSEYWKYLLQNDSKSQTALDGPNIRLKVFNKIFTPITDLSSDISPD